MRDTIQIVFTEQARELLAEVREARGGELTMVIGNGCCDSTAPFLFAGYVRGPNEVEVGEQDGVPVLLDEVLVPLFAGQEALIDVGDPDPDSFSCETELGRRFKLERLPSL